MDKLNKTQVCATLHSRNTDHAKNYRPCHGQALTNSVKALKDIDREIAKAQKTDTRITAIITEQTLVDVM